MAPELSRLPPKLLYWIFIPCDLVSLILQGAGGALSCVSSGVNQLGVNVALAGLALQVATLLIFSAIYIEYIVRYYRSGLAQQHTGPDRLRTRLMLFYASEALAIVMILVRCAFRLYELREGYSGELVRRQDLFIGLEGV